MLNLLFLGIIIIALAVILFLVLRKFPHLANLDLHNLPEEKIYQKKREIINKRIEKSGSLLKTKVGKMLGPVGKLWRISQLQFRIYVGKIERLLHHEQVLKIKQKNKVVNKEEHEQKLGQLISSGEQQLKAGNFDEAEEIFISAIKVDPKSAAAYRGLGDTYLAKDSIEEARQTYKFLTKMQPDDDGVLVKLAKIAEEQGDLEEAIQYFQQAVLINDSFSPRFYHLAELLVRVGQPEVAVESILQAVELESQNPKYLDLLIEIAIICGNKDLALKGYNDLRLVNPEQQKLNSFKDRIDKMGV
ncbi:MAG: methyltransferase FkbM family [Parcubacteria group bacterium Gr01-1014_13]|nr:MAG: methyltransferase FkbM family [Parcubacteria group bacterium Gr01-1014_13]